MRVACSPGLVSMRVTWCPGLVGMRAACGPGLVGMRAAWGPGLVGSINAFPGPHGAQSTIYSHVGYLYGVMGVMGVLSMRSAHQSSVTHGDGRVLPMST